MVVTGQTNDSRLNELKKLVVTSDINRQYFSNGSWTNNGVDLSETEYNGTGLTKIVYYINGIKYIDFPLESRTVFEYTAVGTGSTHNFINEPYYKDPKKENIISSPKIDSDVFIIRQQSSAFENNYLLEYINNLPELQTFAAGNYFNIVNNT